MSVDRMRAYWVYAVVGLGLLWLACGGVFSSCSAANPPEFASYRVTVPEGGGASCGSGTAIHPKLLVTNVHVVSALRDGIIITHSGTGERHQGRVVALWERDDIALVLVEAGGMRYVDLAPTDPIVGQKVWQIGYGHTGVIRGMSGSVRSVEGGNRPFIETDIIIESGDSGCGLFNEAGQLVAVNHCTRQNLGQSPSGAAVEGPSGCSPVSCVRFVLDYVATNYDRFPPDVKEYFAPTQGRLQPIQAQWGNCPGGSCPPQGGGYSQPPAQRPPQQQQPPQSLVPPPQQPPAPPAKGEPGPKGDKGDPGPPGPPGEPCDSAKLREVEIAAQRAAGEAEIAKRETENLGRRIDGLEKNSREAILASQDTTIVLSRIEGRLGSLERKLSGQLRVRFRYDPSTGVLTPLP